MKHRLVATAGHVDHGKTALLKALTGQETDRLDEEKERGLTIDLGFAHLSSNGLRVGFIDVPGHHNFVKNMVSGVGSVQGILFVVSTVEGWEAQSREHFEIIKLLQPDYCCFALTKIDLVDEDMQLLARTEIEDALEGTIYSDAPIVPVSAETGAGVDRLQSVLLGDLEGLTDPPDHGKPYCPIDRMFSVQGQGTVVTGSLSGGPVEETETLTLMPVGTKGRVRGIQQYHQSTETAFPGSRVALNVPDWDYDGIQRGMVATVPDAGDQTDRVDGFLVAPETLTTGIKHDQEMLSYLGTDRKKIQILTEDQRTLSAGDNCLARLKWFDAPVFTRPGDRIILRDFSDRYLLGALTVLDTSPDYPLTSEKHQRWLSKRYPVSPGSLLWSELDRRGAVRTRDLADGTTYSQDEFVRESDRNDSCLRLEDGWLVLKSWWDDQLRTFEDSIREHQRTNPLEPGLSVEEIRPDFPSETLLHQLIQETENIVRDGEYLRTRNFEPAPTSDQQNAIEQLRKTLQQRELETPDRSDLEENFSPEIIDYLIREHKIIELSEERLLDVEVMDQLRNGLRTFLTENQPARLSELRDYLDSSRKYVIPLMEYLDQQGFTVRDGDVRYLRDPSTKDSSTRS